METPAPKSLPAAQAEVQQLEDRAAAVAAALGTIKTQIADKSAALGAETLDDPDRAAQTAREIADLELRARGLEASQAEISRRLAAAQEELNAAQIADAKREIAEARETLDHELQGLLEVSEEWYGRMARAAALQERVRDLQKQYPGQVGSLGSGFAGMQTDGARDLFERFLRVFLENLTPRRDESPETKATYLRLWEIFYAEQSRKNIEYAALHEADLERQRALAAQADAERRARRVVIGAPVEPSPFG